MPNLIVTDRYAFAGVDVGVALSIPFVVNSASILMDIDYPPNIIPAPFSNISVHTSRVIDRCLNVCYRLLFRFTWIQIYRQLNENRKRTGLDQNMDKPHHLTLVNSVFGLDVPRAMSPQHQMVGLLACTQQPTRMESCVPDTQRLPAQLWSWMVSLEKARPLLLITLPCPSLHDPVFQWIHHVIRKIGFRAIWKVASDFNVSENNSTSIYYLQSDTIEEISILQQIASLSAVIISGDAQLVLYALAFGLPILGIPETAEQLEHLNAVARAGAGVVALPSSLSMDRIAELLRRLRYDNGLRTAAARLGKLLNTTGGTKRAVDSIVSVLEFGISHLTPQRCVQSWIQSYFVDVYALYGILLGVVVISLCAFSSVLYSVLQSTCARYRETTDPKARTVGKESNVKQNNKKKRAAAKLRTLNNHGASI
nr:conserved hypothetical protein [Albugo laibachii Nc14]|eukprot:CCA19432.1 conserved hypothetical protein [Albugo laibachii Nc14]